MESDAVILYYYSDEALFPAEANRAAFCTGVLPDVSQRFLNDPVYEQLLFGVQRVFFLSRLHRNPDARFLLHLFGKLPQRRDQTQILEDRRPEVLDEKADPYQRFVDFLPHIFERVDRFCSRLSLPGNHGIEPTGKSHEGLDRIVVQLSGDPFALLLMGTTDLLRVQPQTVLQLPLRADVPCDMEKSRGLFLSEQTGCYHDVGQTGVFLDYLLFVRLLELPALEERSHHLPGPVKRILREEAVYLHADHRLLSVSGELRAGGIRRNDLPV